MATRIQHRRGTTAQWAAANPVLSDGEIGSDRDLKKIKIGDGVTAWASLVFTELKDTNGTQTLTAPTTTSIPLTLKGASGQTASLLELRDSNDAPRAIISASGATKLGVDAQGISGARVAISQDTSGAKGLIIRASNGATANIAEFQNYAGTPVGAVWSDGSVHAGALISAGVLAGVGTAPTAKVLVIRGATTQSGNLAEFQNSSGTPMTVVGSGGGISINSFDLNMLSNNGYLNVQTLATTKGLVVRAASGQNVGSNPIEVQNSSGTVMFAVENNGRISIGTGGTQDQSALGSYFGRFTINTVNGVKWVALYN